MKRKAIIMFIIFYGGITFGQPIELLEIPKNCWLNSDSLVDAKSKPAGVKKMECVGEDRKTTIIEGTVLDRNSGETLLFATVALFKNDKLIGGIETDFEGNFKIDSRIMPDYFEVSYVGYSTKKLNLISAVSHYKVELEPVELICEEVVIIAYEIPTNGCKLICGNSIISEIEEIEEIEEVIVGVEVEEPTEFKFNIFPNPTVDYFKIETSEKIETLVVSDVKGSILLKESNIDPGISQFDLFNYPDGTYLVVIYNGTSQVAHKLIKQSL